jgi:RNA polymerase sigma-70 factor (ECF subfamily)
LNLSKLTDEYLVHRLQTDDGYAFEEIYNRFWTKLYLKALKKTSSKETAEELVQDIFLTLWLGRKQLILTASLDVYLFSSLRYKIISFYRSRLVRTRFAQNQAAAALPAENATESQVLLTEMQLCLDAGLNQLPEKSREVFNLSRIGNLSNKEIGERLLISDKAVEYHITKAIKMLRIYLKDYFSPLMLLLVYTIILLGNKF